MQTVIMNIGCDYFAPRSTQPLIHLGSVNEQLPVLHMPKKV